MRLWSIHPKYLDRKGLLALWREALLAQKVIIGRTKGYRNHPQLKRFKSHPQPVSAMGIYLYHVYREARNRGYHFTKDKIIKIPLKITRIRISSGQLRYEIRHLISKLKRRDAARCDAVQKLITIKPHPLFIIDMDENIEKWERGEING